MGRDERRIQVTGTVEAPPAALFAVLSDPARHVEVDGADMLRGLDSVLSPVTSTGDAWVMNMEQDRHRPVPDAQRGGQVRRPTG